MKFLRRENISIDSVLLTNGRAVTFIAASLISASINLTFIGNLSKDVISIGFISLPASILMIGISLALECSKLIHITMYNTLSELARKLDSKKFIDARTKILKVAKRWFIGYVLYAMLAIMSGLNFSLMNIGKSATAMDAEVRVYEQIIEQHSEIVSLQAELDSFEAGIEPEINELVTKADNLTKLRASLQRTFNAMTEEERKAAGLEKWYDQGEYKQIEEFMNSLKTNYNSTFTNPSQLTRANISAMVSSGIAMKQARMQESLKAKQEALDKKLEEKQISIEEAQYSLEDAKNARILESGSQAGLRKLAEILHIEIGPMIAIFIFILSFLVELTIYQTSPKVKISRRMLFQFTQYLPKNFDVNAFMKEVDEELINYGIIRHSHIDEAELEQSEIKLAKVSNEAKVREIKKNQKGDKELQNLINEAKVLLGDR